MLNARSYVKNEEKKTQNVRVQIKRNITDFYKALCYFFIITALQMMIQSVII